VWKKWYPNPCIEYDDELYNNLATPMVTITCPECGVEWERLVRKGTFRRDGDFILIESNGVTFEQQAFALLGNYYRYDGWPLTLVEGYASESHRQVWVEWDVPGWLEGSSGVSITTAGDLAGVFDEWIKEHPALKGFSFLTDLPAFGDALKSLFETGEASLDEWIALSSPFLPVEDVLGLLEDIFGVKIRHTP